MEYGLGESIALDAVHLVVLILVLMEYGLGEIILIINSSKMKVVLILVLMEYGLGV